MTPDRRMAEFERDGFTVFDRTHSAADITLWRDIYDRICAREGELVWLSNALEADPEGFLPAIANPQILDFLEAVMGPFVQLDSLVINGFPSLSPDAAAGKVNGWHRDRYAETPRTPDYLPPLSCNTIFYLSDLTEAAGALRVVPGSHRRPVVFTPEDRTQPRPDELLLYPKAGDVVVTHYLLAHSGTPNISGKPRYFMAASYNRSWMRHRDTLDGPGIAALKAHARSSSDRRLLRLLGEDDQVWDRTNPYWATGSDEERHAIWISEDRTVRARGADIRAASALDPTKTTREVSAR